ncbi:hypothetical protein ACUNWD_20470 [Sunxiuqinia sp. A32]|uniref:hypothetical protein n=1 Tax=Sunxiuqinia sp. A32 TaxID=3461496 RepID=UPI0040465B68
MANNIRLHYLHRDSGNYKLFGSKDFSNPNNFSLDEIKKLLRQFLIDSMFFYPEKVGIKKFEVRRYCDDNSWYEMEFIELVEGRKGNDTIDDFIERLNNQ